MRLEDVELVGHRSANRGRVALAVGLLACLLTVLAPAAANAGPGITITTSFPTPAGNVAVGDTLTGEIVITNTNTDPDNLSTLCQVGTAGCFGFVGVTLIPSCRVEDANGCDPAGTDPNVFAISSPASGSGTGCPGRSFNADVVDLTTGMVQFTPTSGALVLAKNAPCHIGFTFNVLKTPADSIPGATGGLQTQQRARVTARTDANGFAQAQTSQSVTVKLAAPSVTATSPASPSNNNDPLVTGTASPGSTVTLYDGANCTGTTATGSAAAFNSSGIPFHVNPNTTSHFSATVTDSAGGVSACSSSSVTYVEDSTPPGVPTLTDTDPDSPSPNSSPFIKGTADSGSTVRLYTNPTCTGGAVITGTAAAFASPGLQVSVTPDLSTTFYATASDAVGNASACSAGRIYVEDSTPPPAPAGTGTDPASPANDNTPRILGTAQAGSTVTLYITPTCTGAPAGAGSAAGFASVGIEATVSNDSTTIFYMTATDAAGNVSSCSAGTTYVEDSTAANPPVVTGSSPASPTSQNAGRITGNAPAGSTVRLYTDAACTGAIAAQGTAAAFASPGIAISVPDNSTTTYRARSVDAAGNVSACSTSSITYVEDSSAPTTTIDGGPTGAGAPATPTFTFSSTDQGVTFECRIDSGEFRACSSPFTTPTLSEGAHTFELRATDRAGNTTSVVREFTVGGTAPPPPPPPLPPPPPPSPINPTPTQVGCLGIKGRVYVGTPGRNNRDGITATDIMFGLGGNDSLRGAAGLDCLYGGTGNDLLRGGSGPDRLFGESGNDRLEGLSGNDRLSGSGGIDRLNGGTGNDRLTAGASGDRLIDRRGTDRFSGGSGNDRIDARDSTRADRRKRDRILCGAGTDRVLADPSDIVARDCEKRYVVKRSLRTIAPR